jgi:hypothetical protein
VGLNGFDWFPFLISGDISRYFSKENTAFPYRRNWKRKHIGWVISRIPAKETYLLAGFSDGGTLAHEVASIDLRCKGLIVHSGMFREQTMQWPRNIPILLLTTKGDKTPTVRETKKAHDWYAKRVQDSLYFPDGPLELPVKENNFLKHEFGNGLEVMTKFAKDTLNFDLPIKQHAERTR